MLNYLSRHTQVFLATLGNIVRAPISSLNIIIIIAITLLLPALFYVLVQSTYTLSEHWQGRPQISIFLNAGIDAQEAQLVFDEIKLHPTISLAEYISPKQALEEFKDISGLNNEIDFLDSNPLPPSIVVMPESGHSSPKKLLELKTQLAKIDGIEQIRLDLDWTNRFNAIVGFLSKISQILAILFAVGLLFIIGNTIKLIILNRRDEIEITKLVGGTNAFIGRPFLYYGMLVGIFGAVLALILLTGVRYLLDESVATLSTLYQAAILLYQPSIVDISILILIGGFVGWLAARLSVARHLHQIQPK